MSASRELSFAQVAMRWRALQQVPIQLAQVAAAAVALIVAGLVGSTAIGSGDYGQWLMVSRAFGGLSTPAYRDISGVPPLVPTTIALLHGVLGDPILALHVVAFLVVAGMGAALYFAGASVDGRAVTGLLAVVLGLLLSDQFLGLLAFGALLQATAMVWLTIAFGAFSRAIRSPGQERRWWMVGCGALLLTCLTHVPTATTAVPFGVAAAGLTLLPPAHESIAARARRAAPLLLGFVVIGLYWAVSVAPATVAYATNPASLAYRGPDRLIDLLVNYLPTLLIISAGFATMAVVGAQEVVGRRWASLRGPGGVLLAWVASAWAAFAVSAVGGASTDYPRFAPLLVMPLVVVVAAGVSATAPLVSLRSHGRLLPDHGLIAIALAVVLVAPFSVANYQTQAQGYRLTDDASLAAAAQWADARTLPGKTILAPVREAKWIEGLTGRPTLFASQIRYSFRPDEWDRSLAAGTLFRGDVALVNESFLLTMNDSVATASGAVPRALLIASNHGGEYLDELRLVPTSSVVLDGQGAILATLPAMAALASGRGVESRAIALTSRWSIERNRLDIDYSTSVRLVAGAASFNFEIDARSTQPIGGLRAELRGVSEASIVRIEPAGDSAIVTFARAGLAQPRLRIEVIDGTVEQTAAGGILLSSRGPKLLAQVTNLTPGAPSSGLRMLDPRTLVDDYAVGAVILRRDPAYDDRRARLEALGFHVAHIEGPYIVMVRTGSARPAAE